MFENDFDTSEGVIRVLVLQDLVHFSVMFIGLLSLKPVDFGAFSVSDFNKFRLSKGVYSWLWLYSSRANLRASSRSLLFDSFAIVYFFDSWENDECSPESAEFYSFSIVTCSVNLRSDLSFITCILLSMKEGLRHTPTVEVVKL